MTARYAGDRTTGFASPASDAVEGPIDLSQTLDLKNPSRYPVRVRGATFVTRGI
ncbi:MAG: S24 family peptidase, partial [Acetobacter syzygii]